MAVPTRETIKDIIGQIPFTAELYWLVRQRGRPLNSHFNLKFLQAELPGMVEQATKLRQKAVKGKKVFIFATLHYWIEHAALMGIALAGQGHDVTFGYLPYAEWQSPVNRFDLRRQNLYAQAVLKSAGELIQLVPFLNVHTSSNALPDELQSAIDRVTVYDTQYTLQVEEADPSSQVYKLRCERNEYAARIALAWLKKFRPDVIIVPNGTIQELGVIYRVGRFLRIPTTTYEFGDQRQTIWIGQNAEIMRQETDALWQTGKDKPLVKAEIEEVQSLFQARRKADLYGNFARRWQNTPSQGSNRVRTELGLDERPIVLLATNVLGDSLTLGRNIFSHTMAEWISRTVQYFSGRPDTQLIIRVHPGEVLVHGVAMADVVRNVLPRLPEHIHLIGPKDNINTYDLIEVANLGLVYTTTVGLEMAMSGVPVIVSGQTHFRGRGFTLDPDTWVDYYKVLGKALETPMNYLLNREQVELAWLYAYRFFFNFPRPFPWHLVRVWDDYKSRSLNKVFSLSGMEEYGDTFRYLVGEKLDWSQIFS